MATSFPSGLDSLTNPSSGDSLSSPSHSAQHANVNDAVEALQAKVGADSSVVTSSLDYKVAQLEGRDTAGLVHISRTTVGSAVSSVTVSGAFSADYDNYRILITGGSTSGSNSNLQLTLGATTTGYHYVFVYGTVALAAPALARGGNVAHVVMWGGDTDGMSLGIDLYGPFLSGRTSLNGGSVQYGTNGLMGHLSGFLDNATSYTDFDIAINSGTMTGGTIDVYGYAKA